MARKPHTPTEKPPAAPDLPPLWREQVDALEREIRPVKKVQPSEAGAIAQDALQGYMFGECRRFDSNGRRWLFVREVVDNEFRLKASCDFEGIVLCETSTPLNRIAGSEGEEALLASVERMVADAGTYMEACRDYQQAMRTEAQELPPTEADEAEDPQAAPGDPAAENQAASDPE